MLIALLLAAGSALPLSFSAWSSFSSTTTIRPASPRTRSSPPTAPVPPAASWPASLPTASPPSHLPGAACRASKAQERNTRPTPAPFRTASTNRFPRSNSSAARLVRDFDQRPQRLERVGVGGFLVGAPAGDARKAHRHSAAVAGALGDALEVELEDVRGIDRAYRTEAFEGVLADPPVELVDLLVGEAGIGLRHRDQLALIPEGEGQVGHQGGAPAVPGLRVDQHGVDGVGLDLPLPPVAARPAVPVRGKPALQHQPFHSPFPGLLP